MKDQRILDVSIPVLFQVGMFHSGVYLWQMESGSYFIVHSVTTEQENALKAFVKALNMDFTITTEKPYNPDFVSKIRKSRQDFKDGKGTPTTLDDLNALWK